MVKLAPSLPKEYDDNGIESNGRHLLAAYPKQTYLAVVGLVRTKEITENENFERIPKIEFVAIELAVDGDDDADVRQLLQRLHDARVQHIKQPLDLPDEGDVPEPAAPLELEASTGQYTLTVVDQPAGKFSVELRSPSGALVLSRGALPTADYDAPFPGRYQVGQLGGPLGELAALLVQEFEQGFTTDPEDVVDAELVDENPTTTDAEEA
ncbi:MAG: hypothetical protein BGO45_04725 [Microbacterium sp. 71-36]|uniref:hypothetical protein n=1 Tax=unclassified Microbacterium TaxID=2609290 RepID=UPI00086B19CC|nr:MULTISPECIES: hypothetical protein [unclassified Microbacterium]MBN9210530.1 hypothetical protein [Microbacterium sp.]ODT43196.1 MAG: hypothetical protein ABS60_00145 [Microbacterium sp. SCN 71-17]OJV75804.1 MAG: hypothetical protein BGO45_04725 [Microbacterium sp. 71-36]